ncbi:MAG: universal stress protein [Rhodocyclaceae bacterium]|nr:universal stress protein [Rhodocyclaceae bacterium]
MSFVPGTLLLAHHGTDGAKRAEAQAFALASPGRTRIVHLYVVPEFWAGMQGDDWLNNAWTRDAFAVHVERQLDAEATTEVDGLAARCLSRGFACEALIRFGEPAECLLAAAREVRPELVVIGPPRPKGVEGYRSRMDLEKLARGLAAPLLVAR